MAGLHTTAGSAFLGQQSSYVVIPQHNFDGELSNVTKVQPLRPGWGSLPLNVSFFAPCAGPVLLEDIQTIQRVSDLTKERIPPRRVHAQGAVAKGYFEVRSAVTTGLDSGVVLEGAPLIASLSAMCCR